MTFIYGPFLRSLFLFVPICASFVSDILFPGDRGSQLVAIALYESWNITCVRSKTFGIAQRGEWQACPRDRGRKLCEIRSRDLSKTLQKKDCHNCRNHCKKKTVTSLSGSMQKHLSRWLRPRCLARHSSYPDKYIQ